MKTPKSFGSRFGVLNVGMTVITLLYAAFGLLGYMRYGEDSGESITLNLPRGDVYVFNAIKKMNFHNIVNIFDHFTSLTA